MNAAEILEKYDRDGFVVLENFLTETELKDMKQEMQSILGQMNPKEHPSCVFVTDNEDKHASDNYFIDSADKIRFFYEDGALDKQTGELTVDKHLAMNKVGHALHWLNPIFKKISFSDKIKNLLAAIHYEKPAIVQGMYIFKQPRIGGVVGGHYDATFLYNEPVSKTMGLWFALDDATLDNGCLWLSPGSHKDNDCSYRFVRTEGTNPDKLLHFTGEKPDFDSKPYVAAPVKKGACVLIHGLVWHKSAPNTSGNARHAYTLHMIDTHQAQWSHKNWLQETATYKFPLLNEN